MSKAENSIENSWVLEKAFPGRESHSFNGIIVEVKDCKDLFNLLTKPEMRRSGEIYIQEVELPSPLRHVVGTFNSDGKYYGGEIKIRSEKNLSPNNPFRSEWVKYEPAIVGKGKNKPPFSFKFQFEEGRLEVAISIGSGEKRGPINLEPLELSSFGDFEKQVGYFLGEVQRNINFLYGISEVSKLRKVILLDIAGFQKEYYFPKKV